MHPIPFHCQCGCFGCTLSVVLPISPKGTHSSGHDKLHPTTLLCTVLKILHCLLLLQGQTWTPWMSLQSCPDCLPGPLHLSLWILSVCYSTAPRNLLVPDLQRLLWWPWRAQVGSLQETVLYFKVISSQEETKPLTYKSKKQGILLNTSINPKRLFDLLSCPIMVRGQPLPTNRD